MKYNRTKCLDCGKEHGETIFHTASHQRKHKRTLAEYLEKFFILTEKNENKCVICDNECEYTYKIDHVNKTYEAVPLHKSNFCSNGCRDIISLKVLGHKYDPKTFVHIGSRSEYIAIVHNISIDEAKKMKFKHHEIKTSQKTNLEGYIIRYGEELGKIKYQERCDKIGKASTLDWYVEKYGKNEGVEKYNTHIKNLKYNTLGTTKSKIQKIVGCYLNDLKIKYQEEYQITTNNGKKPSCVDYYLPDDKIVIEFYGDYWHASPTMFERNQFHKTLKCSAEDVWAKDEKRINLLLEQKDIVNGVIIIWETAELSNDIIINAIKSINSGIKKISINGKYYKKFRNDTRHRIERIQADQLQQL